jgi:glycosyltransferase involved in cell wall biosynthesis
MVDLNPAGPAKDGKTPRVAVIVPAYGVAHLVGEALTSVQRQTLTDWECIIIDDGAPDDVAASVAPFLNDRRFRFLSTGNHGVSAARNRAIAASTAPLVTMLDGDDLLRPDYLASVVPLLEEDPSLRLVTCNARIFGAVSSVGLCVDRPHAQIGTLRDVLDRSFNVYIGSTFRRADFVRVGGFDETMAQCEDFDLWVRLMVAGGRARYVDRVLGEYRVRAGSASANGGRMLLGTIRVYDKTRAALGPDAPEVPLLNRLLADTHAALAFEHAIDRIIDGDSRRGVSELLAMRGQVHGPVWRAALMIWHFFPRLARPMLRWRRQAHTRGAAAGALLPSMLEGENLL